jgi:hypothetical protein
MNLKEFFKYVINNPFELIGDLIFLFVLFMCLMLVLHIFA